MTDGLDQAIVNAGLALLAADTTLTVIDGPAPNPTPALPYVVVWATVDWPPDDPLYDALNNLSRHATARWFVHGVAENLVSWRAVMQRVRTQLLNVRPVIANVQPGLIRMEDGSPPPISDEVLGSVVITGVHVFRLTCTT